MKSSKIKQSQTESENNSHLKDEYEQLMKGFPQNNPLINQEWTKTGDFFNQFSIYDENLVTVSGILS